MCCFMIDKAIEILYEAQQEKKKRSVFANILQLFSLTRVLNSPESLFTFFTVYRRWK